VNVKTDHFVSQPPFGPYDDAVDAFKQFAGGTMSEVTVIRSPRRMLNQFNHDFRQRPRMSCAFAASRLIWRKIRTSCRCVARAVPVTNANGRIPSEAGGTITCIY